MNTFSCGHPVDFAGADRLNSAEAVPVQEFAFEKVRHRSKADVRMRRHVEAGVRSQHLRPHLIQEDERADHFPRKILTILLAYLNGEHRD
jgi:hypothetical protein